MKHIVFFDVETSGLDPKKHEVIQIAAVAVTATMLEEVDAFECKVEFDVDRASPEALRLNHYNPLDARVPRHDALGQFNRFLEGYKSVELISGRTGNPYYVAQLAGHNIAAFDIPFLSTWYSTHNAFMPAAFMGLDTLQLALWWNEMFNRGDAPKNLKLPTLADYFGIIREGEDHDALSDVRTNVHVCATLLSKLALFGREWPS